MPCSNCILCILEIDLILVYDARNTLFVIYSISSFKKTQIKKGVTRHDNHFNMFSS